MESKAAVFTVFDIETTAKSYKEEGAQIIEITGLKLDASLNPVDQYSSLVSYRKKLSKDTVQLTNITDELLQDEGRNLYDVMSEFLHFAKGTTLVAQNAEFDLTFIYHTFKILVIDFDEFDFYDTLVMARHLIPFSKKHNLLALCTELSIPLNGHHRSENDVEATTHLFRLLYRMMRRRKRDYLNQLHYLNEEPSERLSRALYTRYDITKIEKMFFEPQSV